MSSLEGLSHPAPQAQARRSTSSHNGGKAGPVRRAEEGFGGGGVGVVVVVD